MYVYKYKCIWPIDWLVDWLTGWSIVWLFNYQFTTISILYFYFLNLTLILMLFFIYWVIQGLVLLTCLFLIKYIYIYISEADLGVADPAYAPIKKLGNLVFKLDLIYVHATLIFLLWFWRAIGTRPMDLKSFELRSFKSLDYWTFTVNILYGG